MGQREGDQALARGLGDQRDRDQHRPPEPRHGDQAFTHDERHGQQRERGEAGGVGHDRCRGEAASQLLHGDEIGGVEHSRDHAEAVAPQLISAELDARSDHGRGAEQGEREAGDEQERDALAEQEPRGQSDEDRRDVGEQRRVGDRSHRDRPVPEGKIAGEEEAGKHEQAEIAAPDVAVGAAAARFEREP